MTNMLDKRANRPEPVTAMEIRGEVAHCRDRLANGTLGQSGTLLVDRIAELKDRLTLLEPWLDE